MPCIPLGENELHVMYRRAMRIGMSLALRTTVDYLPRLTTGRRPHGYPQEDPAFPCRAARDGRRPGECTGPTERVGRICDTSSRASAEPGRPGWAGPRSVPLAPMERAALAARALPVR